MYYCSEQIIHPESMRVANQPNGNIFCKEPGCDFRIHRLKQFQQHLKNEHDVEFKTRTMYFDGLDNFAIWREKYEREECFKFSLLTTKKLASHIYYYCSLGRKVLVVNGKKQLSYQCPARLIVNHNRTSNQAYVDIVEGHYGHPLPDITTRKTSELTKNERTDLKQIMRDHGFDEVRTKDYITKCSIDTTKKELLLREFEKKKFHETYKWAEEKFLLDSSKDTWAELFPDDNGKSIIVHKYSGEVIDDHRDQAQFNPFGLETLNQKDFMLGVMTPNQCDMIREFGSTIILELVQVNADVDDSIKSLYVLVMDKLGRELQVGFCIHNSPKGDAYACYFLAMKRHCGPLYPRLVVVNSEEVSAQWLKVFPHASTIPMFSPWSIMDSFGQHLSQSNITDEYAQELNNLFKDLVYEGEYEEFTVKLANLLKILNEDPGCACLLNYVTSILIPYIHEENQSKLTWAHHSLPHLHEDITQLGLTFSAERLKSMRTFIHRKLGRCVFLMLQRQRQRRNVRKLDKRRPPTLNKAPGLDEQIRNKSMQEMVQREKTRQGLKDQCKKLMNSIQTMDRTHHKAIADRTLELCKTIHIDNKNTQTLFQIRCASSIYDQTFGPEVPPRPGCPRFPKSKPSVRLPKMLILPKKKATRVSSFKPKPQMTLLKSSKRGPIVLSTASDLRQPKKRKYTLNSEQTEQKISQIPVAHPSPRQDSSVLLMLDHSQAEILPQNGLQEGNDALACCIKVEPLSDEEDFLRDSVMEITAT